MRDIVKYVCQALNCSVECVMIHHDNNKNMPGFKTTNVATILGYVSTKKAVQMNVDEADKQQ
jgi:hypothetical protein